MSTTCDDQNVFGSGWSLRFSHSHVEESLEIEDELQAPPSDNVIERLRQVEYLESISRTISRILYVIVDYDVEEEARSMHEAHIQLFKSRIVNDTTDTMDETVTDKLCSDIREKCTAITKNETFISPYLFNHVLQQFILYYASSIIDVLNYGRS